MQSLTAPSTAMSPSESTRQTKPLGRLGRAGLILGICAALGVGVLAEPLSTVSHHAAAVSSTHLVDTSGVTGGPGDM